MGEAIGVLKRILLIDDDAQSCGALKNMLDDDYEIIEAHNAASALEILSRKRIGIAVLNMFLGGKESTQTLVLLKQRYNYMPVIIIAGQSTSEESAKRALENGAADFLCRPFMKCVVKKRIENMLTIAAYLSRNYIFSDNDKQNGLKTMAENNHRLYIDPVTGVYNRRYFDDKLRDLEGEFAFAMLDMDNFKQINDTFGHPAGDAALAAAAQAIKRNVRSDDDIIRYGGDEFFLLLKNMQKGSMKKKLEIILHAVENAKLDDYPDIKMTVSIGGAYEKGKLSQTLRKADIAMYEAKNSKNSISIYGE